MMKKIIGLFLIVFIGILGYSGAWYLNTANCPNTSYTNLQTECSKTGDYVNVVVHTPSGIFLFTPNPSGVSNPGQYSGVEAVSISWCTGTVFGKTGVVVQGIVAFKECCPEGETVTGDNNDRCIVDCSEGIGIYYGKKKDKCCITSSGYIAYDWKKKGRTGNVWYYDDCDEGVLYKKGANDVRSKQVDVDSLGSGVNSYSFCGKGNVVTENGRCIPCAGAANLSGIRIHPDSTINCHIVCSENEVAFTGASGAPGCCPGTVKDGVCHQELLKMGVRVNNACLIDGQCGLNIYRILGIRASDNYDPSVSNVASDIINAAISFMGTVVTIVFVVAGIICSMNSISGKDTKKMMKVFVDSAVGMLMVWGSYAIIRLVQFIATAGS